MRKIISFLYTLLIFSCVFDAEKSDFITIEAHSNDCKISIDGIYSEVSDIKTIISDRLKELDSTEKSKFYAKLKFSEETTMGRVNDIKLELQKASILNLRYYTIEAKKCDSLE